MPHDPVSLDYISKRLQEHPHWYCKSYSGYFMGIHLQGLAITAEAEMEHGIRYGTLYQNYRQKDHFDWFWDNDELIRIREWSLGQAKTQPELIDLILREGVAQHAAFMATSEEVAALNLREVSSQSLAQAFRVLRDGILATVKWGYCVDSFLSNTGEDWLEVLIKGYLGERATQDVIETLTLPTFASFVNDAEVLFLEIALALKREDEALAKLLAQDYERRYFSIRSNYFVYERARAEAILGEARTWVIEHRDEDVEKEVQHLKRRVQQNAEQKQAVYRTLAVPSELQAMIRFSEVFTHLQDLRKERVLRVNTLMYECVDEAQRQLNIPNPLGFYLTVNEMIGLLEGKALETEMLEKRYQEGCFVIFRRAEDQMFSADEFRKEGWHTQIFAVPEESQTLKGTTAFRGVVRGTVHVLKNVNDIREFKQGEILVANQTTPEYVPAMKKAVAMITDQGGITCHAAIVSRELRIPTVIGTKVATQVLKTGDLVEVDAEKGIVKKLTNL